MKIKYLSIFVLFLFALHSFGQVKQLTLDDAIATGLKNNFSILIAQNDVAIAQNNNTLGNAGFLPEVGINASVRENMSNIKTENQAGEVAKTNSANTSSLTSGVTLDWTLFDGFGMFIRKDKLSLMQNMGETAFRSTVENVVSEIIVGYFAVVQNKNRLQVLQNALDFSNTRLSLIQKKYQIGSASELAFLQATTDLNADSAAYLRQLVLLKNSKADLNTMLVENVDVDFDVIETIYFENLMSYDAIREVLPTVNSQIMLAQQRAAIAEIDYKLTHSPRYPQIGFFTDYNYSRSKYDFGQTRLNQNNGPVFGLNLAVPVFDGFNKKRVSANARIDAESTKLELEQTVKVIDLQLYQLFNNYQNNMKLVTLERSNLKVSQQNTKIAFEKFRVGELSDIDLRQIQLSQLEAENSLLQAQFMAKKSETELLRLSGNLILKK